MASPLPNADSAAGRPGMRRHASNKDCNASKHMFHHIQSVWYVYHTYTMARAILGRLSLMMRTNEHGLASTERVVKQLLIS